MPGDLGRRFRRRRRWSTEGRYCAGDFGAALTVNGQAWLIAIGGQLQGAVDIGIDTADPPEEFDLHSLSVVGDVTGTLVVHRNVGSLKFGSPGSNTGQVQAPVLIESNVNRIGAYAGTGASATINVTGDLGRRYR